MKSDITVVITTYNQSYESVRRSIISVLHQEDVKFDIIIADDCSKTDYFDEYRELFSEYKFENYQLIRNETNFKTVRNIANALSFTRAPYVKTIDAGDMLYSSKTLRDILDFCKQNNVQVGFGDIIRFRKDDDGTYYESDYNAPLCAGEFDVQVEYNPARLLKKQMNEADWTPASAQFYRTDVYLELLTELYERYHVEYCQDFASVMALEKHRVYHYRAPIYWYEWGVGISTNGSVDSRKRLYQDHDNFYKVMASRRPLGVNLGASRAKFLLRKVIAFSPLYASLIRLLGRYDSEERPLKNHFALMCAE